MKIAVYPGSFNPLHIGHLAIIRALTQGMDFDTVYLIVSPKNPLKDAISEDTGRARYLAALDAVARHGDLNVRVDDIEFSQPSPQYTIRTLDLLRAREPQNDFTLVIGADNLADIRRWRDYKRILTEYGVAVYPRTGFDCTALRTALMQESAQYRIRLLDAPMVDISSTQIREALERGEDVSEFLM